MREIGKSRVCYEGDGSGGGIGSFFSNLFGGAQPAAAGPTGFDVPIGSADPTFGGTAPSGGSTGFDVPVGSQDPTGAATAGANAAGGLNIPLTGAIPSTPVTAGAVPFTASSPTLNSALSSQGPGVGTGAIPGPGGGAAATAAPASLGDDATRFAAGGGANQTPGFTNAVATNTGLDPAAVGGSKGVGTGTTVDTAFNDPSFDNIKKAIGANANILLPAAGLGWQALQAQKAPEGLNNIRAAADQTSTQSALLQNYLTTGTLPPGLQAGLDQAKEAAKSAIRARYANLPGQSSAMETELTNADQTAAAQGGQLAIQLFSQGMSEANVSNQLYEAILNQSLERDKELSSAVGNFSTALAGGGPSVKLSLG